MLKLRRSTLLVRLHDILLQLGVGVGGPGQPPREHHGGGDVLRHSCGYYLAPHHCTTGHEG